MTIDGTKWIAAIKQAFEDGKVNGWKPASGEVCAIATVRYIRDGLMAKLDDKSKAIVKAECSELIKAIQTSKLQGFASNASAASAAAGFKAEATGAAKMVED